MVCVYGSRVGFHIFNFFKTKSIWCFTLRSYILRLRAIIDCKKYSICLQLNISLIMSDILLVNSMLYFAPAEKIVSDEGLIKNFVQPGLIIH